MMYDVWRGKITALGGELRDCLQTLGLRVYAMPVCGPAPASLMSLELPISPLQLVPEHPGTARGITLYIKRDDLLHPLIEGSKARKLAAVLPDVRAAYPGGLLTFGGAFSNHLHAVAVAGALLNLPTYGIIRGEYVHLQNSTLLACQAQGMQLFPWPKAQYDACKALGWKTLENEFPRCFLLPEGGSTPQALRACAAISEEIFAQLPPGLATNPLYLCAPAGTACTVAGMIAGLGDSRAKVLVYPVSNQGVSEASIGQLLEAAGVLPGDWAQRFDIVPEYVFGGFAKFHAPVMEFARWFLAETNIRLDPVYTAKMLYGVFDGLKKGRFEPHSTVVALHTGGMQGWEGFAARYGDAGRL